MAVTNSGFTVTTWWGTPVRTIVSRSPTASLIVTRETGTESISTKSFRFGIAGSGFFKDNEGSQGFLQIRPGWGRNLVENPREQGLEWTGERRKITGEFTPVRQRNPVPEIFDLPEPEAGRKY